MDKNWTKVYISLIGLIVTCSLFLFFDKDGIKLGYKLNGGKETVESTPNPQDILRDYNEQLTTYNLYKDSNNSTAVGWANNAKMKANELADQYNSIIGEPILETLD